MSDNKTDDNDGVLLDLLVDRFLPFDAVLANVRKHRTIYQFRKFAEMGLSTLKPDEIDKALDENFVPWHKFHEDIVRSVAEAKGTTKAGAVRGSVKHMDRKASLQKIFVGMPGGVSCTLLHAYILRSLKIVVIRIVQSTNYPQELTTS